MPNRSELARKASSLRDLHEGPRLLVLPNIWDPLGARMLQSMGFPAVATASAAVAFSLGYDDGEIVAFDTMLDAISRIAASVDVPVTADIERGYASAPDGVAGNVRRVLDAGAAGINIEDSTGRGTQLFGVEAQCDRIRAVREMAQEEGVPLVINARTDVFMIEGDTPWPERTAEAIRRAGAYLEAGADCIYPITAGDLPTLREIRKATGALLNVYADETTAPMRDLEAAGIARLSIGPGLIRTSFTAMRSAAAALQSYGSYDSFTTDAVTSDDIRAICDDHRRT